MPSIDFNYLKLKIENFNINKYPIFVETGTLRGSTTFEMEKYFPEVHTIEVSEKLYKNVKNKYKGNKITFHLGDSGIILNNLSENLNNNAVFFLDGHFSNGETSKGEKDVPLYESLNHINKNFKYKGIIIIHDCRLFRQINKSITGGTDFL